MVRVCGELTETWASYQTLLGGSVKQFSLVLPSARFQMEINWRRLSQHLRWPSLSMPVFKGSSIRRISLFSLGFQFHHQLNRCGGHCGAFRIRLVDQPFLCFPGRGWDGYAIALPRLDGAAPS